METEVTDKVPLIKFIRLNDPAFSKTNLDAYTLTQLVILKTEIELKLRNKYKK